MGSAVGLRLRFTFISFGVGWKRDAILRHLAKEKEGGEAGKNAILRLAVLQGRMWSLSAGRVGPVDGFPHVLGQHSLA